MKSLCGVWVSKYGSVDVEERGVPDESYRYWLLAPSGWYVQEGGGSEDRESCGCVDCCLIKE